MSNVFVSLLGPSGVGKSLLVETLLSLFPGKYLYIKPYTTRDLRTSEKSKMHVSLDEFQELSEEGQILLPNYVHGNWYGPSKLNIAGVIESGGVPIIDWPVDRAEDLRKELSPLNVLNLYIRPPSLDVLKTRISSDNRDPTGSRYEAAVKEIYDVDSGLYGTIDSMIVNVGDPRVVARGIDLMVTRRRDRR